MLSLKFVAVALLPLPSFAANIVKPPQSLDKFKEEYTNEKADWSSGSALLAANKEIQGSATPIDADILTLWSWYHSISGEVQSNAKAYMTAAATGAQGLLLSDFVTKLNLAIPFTSSTNDIINYNALVGATKPVKGTPAGVIQETVDAWEVLQHLSSAEQTSMRAATRARMLESYKKTTWTTAQKTLTDFKTTMEFIGQTTGGIDTSTSKNANKEQDSAAVYKAADADLKKSIDALLVDYLRTKIV